ncbi:hypothetical protein Tco_0172373, partial [Tanacetum coccineum]
KIVQIRQRLQAARDRQRSYANESLTLDTLDLSKSLNGLAQGHSKELINVQNTFHVSKLELPKELINVHNTFHVSNLKKYLSDESLIILMKELRLDDKLNFVEEPVKIMDQEVKQLKQSRIPTLKEDQNLRGNAKIKFVPSIHICFQTSLWHPTKSRDEIFLREGDYNNP